MMPEYLYIIKEIFDGMGEFSGYERLKNTYDRLSRPTKELYHNDIEAYKRAVKFEINSGLKPHVMAKNLTDKLLGTIRDLYRSSGETIESLSRSTTIPEAVIETIISKGEGSFNNTMILLNYFGRGLKIINWEDMFPITSEESDYNPITIKPLSQSLYTLMENNMGVGNIPDGRHIGLDVQFDDFVMGKDLVLQPTGQLSGYDGGIYTNAAFSDGNKFLLTGVIDDKTYKYLLNLHLSYPNHEALYIGYRHASLDNMWSSYPNHEPIYVGERHINLDNLLRSTVQLDEGDTNRYFVIDIKLPMNYDNTAIDNSKIVEITLVIDNDFFMTKLDLSLIDFIPFTEEVIDDGGNTTTPPEVPGTGDTSIDSGTIGTESGDTSDTTDTPVDTSTT